MSRPAQVQQMVDRVEEIRAEMAGNAPDPQHTEDVIVQQPPEPPATVNKEEYDRLEQRYRTLQGMLSADNARHRNELAVRDNAIKTLEDQVLEIQARLTNNASVPAKYVTDEDVKEYGDTLDMVRRAAKEEAEAIAAQREQKLLERISDLENRFGVVQNTIVPRVEEMSQHQYNQFVSEFWGALETQVPDWRSINDDINFKNWLVEEDPTTGATRQQFLSYARENYDALRVIKIFNEWKRIAAGGQTPAPKPKAQLELERQIAPAPSKGAAVVIEPNKTIWTTEKINQFYKDVQLGVYRNKPEERRKLEADLFLAKGEGRYNP